MEEAKYADLWKWTKSDFARGLIVVVLSAVLTILLEMIKNAGLVLDVQDWQQVLTIAITSGLGYLIKNLATNKEGKLLGKMKVK